MRIPFLVGALLFLSGAAGTATATPSPPPLQPSRSSGIVELASVHCGRYAHYVRGHHTRSGHWIRGHCVRNRHY